MDNVTNMIIIAGLIAIGMAALYFIFKQNPDHEKKEEEDVFALPYLRKSVQHIFNEILNQNIAELYLNKTETLKREEQKARLNRALRSCTHGNIGEKEYIKDYIKDLLQDSLNVNENTIDEILPFDDPEELSTQDKFEILLYQQKKEHGRLGFEKLNELCNFDKDKERDGNVYYEATKEDVEEAYEIHAQPLDYIDKLEIITQRIYQEAYGFSVIDEIRDMTIDGVSGGVSGVSTEQYYYMEECLHNDALKPARTYDSVWVFLHGKPIHMSCLSFGTQRELIRVCKNLYMYDNVGHLTSTSGYKLTYMHDSSRVVVVRPNFTTHWSFFVRKFDSAKSMDMDWLVRGDDKQDLIELTKWAVKGCLNVIVSGDQNSGKTTFLRSMIQEIDPRYPIRTTEQDFELWLSNTFPELNVQSFRETETVSLMEALGIEKKTDGAIMILGEINSPELAEAYISLTQAGTKMCICTIHTLTADDLVDYMRNSLLSANFTNEMIAEEQVANSIHLDIHWEKTSDGNRYISRVTEIVPHGRDDEWPEDRDECVVEGLKRLTRKRAFTTNDIFIYEDGRYVLKNAPGERLTNRILRNLSGRNKEEFLAFNSQLQDKASINKGA